MTKIEVEIPFKFYSPNVYNSMHWTAQNTIARQQKIQIWNALFEHELEFLKPPLCIRLTRTSTKPFDPDNYISSCKHIRDKIAQLISPDQKIGRSDDNPLILWQYQQEHVPKKPGTFLKITITEKTVENTNTMEYINGN